MSNPGTKKPAIPAAVLEAQRKASSPGASAWVSANAGSGKTHVLTQRVIRLLLAGARPSAILCLTYTKAAAAEMSNRVFAQLSAWSRLDDRALAERIADIEGEWPQAGTLLMARQLFARALETPGGLKIQTIHAFCEAVLHRFPLEANVAGHFEVLDDSAATALLAEARRSLLTAATPENDRTLAEAFMHVLEAVGEDGLDRLLSGLISKRAAIRVFQEWAGQNWSGDNGGVEAALRHAFELGEREAEPDIIANAWPLPSLSGASLATYCAAAESQKGKKAREFSAGLQTVAQTGSPEDRWRLLKSLFLTEKNAPRSLSTVTPSGVIEMMPDAGDRVAFATAHIAGIFDRLVRLSTVRLTCAALTLARRLDADYEAMKRDHGRLDFDDLVARTASLLTRNGGGAWVHYKLDQGIDHILIDEAQDTSPVQWSVVGSLSEDFFAGEGAKPLPRTMFAVGDEKQSIYSFQGARPERFEAERRGLASRVAAASGRFESVPLHVSFRSTAQVLSAVDTVFEIARNRAGLTSSGAPDPHDTVRRSEPGRVDLWDLIIKEKAVEEEDWLAPYDAIAENAPPALLARRIALTLRDWIGRKTIREKGVTRAMQPGDILVLVRKRDAFVAALTRELKRLDNVPVAGADRLSLAAHIAVQDLTALGRLMLLPDDDLSLAAVLKSPLFGATEEQLYALAAGRGETESLFARLASLALSDEAPWADIHGQLDALLPQARELPVYEFYARLLGAGGGRRKFLARLGGEAGDILDEFLALALSHERTAGIAGLQSFLAALDSDSPEIKREMDRGRNEVRIMTVHASKGLEAPVVFLVDSGGAAAQTAHLPALRELPLAGQPDATPPAIVWVPSAKYETTITTPLKEAAKQSAEEEYHRLLYVGMTRAADRLVVCGYRGINEVEHHWQKMVQEALAARDGDVAEATFSAGDLEWTGLTFGADDQADAAPSVSPAPARPVTAEAMPGPPPKPKRLPRPLYPSGAGAIIEGDAPEPVRGSPFLRSETSANSSMERGRIVHRFLQILPAMDPATRETAACRYLERAVPGWSETEREAILHSVFAVLDDSQFAPVFAPGSRAEVSIMGELTLGGVTQAVSGRIDRLAVDDERVLIVDFKTNRPPILTAADSPAAYKAQLAIYREILKPLYPGRTIDAALVYTEAPALVALREDELDAALQGLAAS